MKLKLIALACITACAGSAFAAAAKPNSCTLANGTALDSTNITAADLVNKCAPEITFFIGGASAQANALKTVLVTNGVIFDTSKPFVKVRDVAQTISGTGSSTTTATTGLNADYNTIAYIGYGAGDPTTSPIAGKRVMVVYNKANGSFAGVNTLLTGAGGAGEETTLVTTTVAEQATATGKATPCVLASAVKDATATYDTMTTYACTTEATIKSGWGVDKQKALHMALSDVRPSEAVPGVVKSWKDSGFPSIGTGMQGFGVAVNGELYKALQAREVAAKRMPASCIDGTVGSTMSAAEVVGQPAIVALGQTAVNHVLNADCQPSISSAQYVSLMTGKIATANALLGTTGDSKTITLNRRVKTSGTQAAAEAFFAGRALYNAKATATDGYLEPLGGTAGTPDTTAGAGLTVITHSTTDGVMDAIRNEPTNYALGVISLDKGFDLDVAKALKGALWVKLDGISPNLSKSSATATAVDKKNQGWFCSRLSVCVRSTSHSVE